MTFGRGQTVDDALNDLFSKITESPTTQTTPKDEIPIVRPPHTTGEKEDLLASLIKYYIQRESLDPDSKEYDRLTKEIISILNKLEGLER
ncbi:MAG: hypothetical protein BWX56_01359 [Euryarchaeota archaeon ADurb.Bin023]|jgi:hypothetical protein|nr:MAG: hypothetical protein BWX56_01359 [Euryarchaeota archaeon ADurb.Bin023]